MGWNTIRRSIALRVAMASLLAPAAAAQTPLSLQQAVSIALEKNPQRRIAVADQRAAEAGVQEARSALLPRVSFTESAARGNDPVYVFGTRLRQERFTVADFALNRLNTPTPIGNFSSRFSGNWKLFDSFANVKSVARVKDLQQAAGHQLERADQETIFHVAQAYLGLLLAQKQQEVAEQSVKTAQSILDRSQARYESGVVVQSDLLSAQVRLASRQEELIRSRNNVAFGAAQLDTAMGVPANTEFQLSQSLSEGPLPQAALTDLEQRALASRPDLKQIEAQQMAQQKSVSIAKSSLGPRLNAFGGWETDSATLSQIQGNNWAAGLELQIDLFQGGAKRAQLTREKALQERIAAARQAAADQVRLEVRRTYYDFDSARQQVGVAQAAAGQAEESMRINQNRYDAGITTITDLLTIEEATRRAQTDYWEAVYRMRTSYANLELATGTLSAGSPVIMP
ncbi:MAG TPA: TolC family protein [Terriglobales bacterium]|nr:TolC family protein [Terriglobales bacterium]